MVECLRQTPHLSPPGAQPELTSTGGVPVRIEPHQVENSQRPKPCEKEMEEEKARERAWRKVRMINEFSWNPELHSIYPPSIHRKLARTYLTFSSLLV